MVVELKCLSADREGVAVFEGLRRRGTLWVIRTFYKCGALLLGDDCHIIGENRSRADVVAVMMRVDDMSYRLVRDLTDRLHDVSAQEILAVGRRCIYDDQTVIVLDNQLVVPGILDVMDPAAQRVGVVAL